MINRTEKLVKAVNEIVNYHGSPYDKDRLYNFAEAIVDMAEQRVKQRGEFIPFKETKTRAPRFDCGQYVVVDNRTVRIEAVSALPHDNSYLGRCADGITVGFTERGAEPWYPKMGEAVYAKTSIDSCHVNDFGRVEGLPQFMGGCSGRDAYGQENWRVFTADRCIHYFTLNQLHPAVFKEPPKPVQPTILNCPYCGSPAEYNEARACVICKDGTCVAEGPFGTREDAIAKWNRVR